MSAFAPLVYDPASGAKRQLAASDDLLVQGQAVAALLGALGVQLGQVSGQSNSNAAAVTALTSAVLAGAVRPYATLAALNADASPAAGIMGLVYADPALSNNLPLYVKTGAAGAAGWTATSITIANLAGPIAPSSLALGGVKQYNEAHAGVARATTDKYRRVLTKALSTTGQQPITAAGLAASIAAAIIGALTPASLQIGHVKQVTEAHAGVARVTTDAYRRIVTKSLATTGQQPITPAGLATSLVGALAPASLQIGHVKQATEAHAGVAKVTTDAYRRIVSKSLAATGQQPATTASVTATLLGPLTPKSVQIGHVLELTEAHAGVAAVRIDAYRRVFDKTLTAGGGNVTLTNQVDPTKGATLVGYAAPDGGGITTFGTTVKQRLDTLSTGYLYAIVKTKDTSGNRQFTVVRRIDNAVMFISGGTASPGNNTEARIEADGFVTWWNDTLGELSVTVIGSEAAPIAGGPVYPVLPSPNVYCLGHSFWTTPATTPSMLMFGVLQSITASANPGVSWFNDGMGGQDETQMQMRFCSLPIPMTVAGGVIPADGSFVACSVNYAWPYQVLDTADGSKTRPALAPDGTPLLLQSNGTGTYTVARAAAGPAITWPAAQTIVMDPSKAIGSAIVPNQSTMILWPCRNHLTLYTVPQMMQAVANIVEKIKPYTKRVLILGDWTKCDGTENKGSAAYNQYVAYNNAMAAEYGQAFIDTRRWVIDNAQTIAAAENYALTSADLANLAPAVDTIPPGFTCDQLLHPAYIIHDAMARSLVYPRLQALGWLK